MVRFFKLLFQFFFGVSKPTTKKSNVSAEETKIIAQTAHHEAGHAIMGFYVGWSVKSLAIYFNEDNTVKYGSTIYNFGVDEKYALFFKNSKDHLTEFKKMNQTEKTMTIEFLGKRIFAVLGGPVAEHFHMNGHTPYRNNLNQVDIKVLDGSYEFLRQIGQPRTRVSDLQFVLELFEKNSIFNGTVSRLASRLITNEKLNETEIDKIIDDNGFSVYLEK